MVNVPNIERVIASIRGEVVETEDLGFNMGGYVYPTGAAVTDHSARNCNWVADIAGHAFILSSGFDYREAQGEHPDDIEAEAAEYLGISPTSAPGLFYDLPAHIDLANLPASVAIRALEQVKATGKVSWEDACVTA